MSYAEQVRCQYKHFQITNVSERTQKNSAHKNKLSDTIKNVKNKRIVDVHFFNIDQKISLKLDSDKTSEEVLNFFLDSNNHHNYYHINITSDYYCNKNNKTQIYLFSVPVVYVKDSDKMEDHELQKNIYISPGRKRNLQEYELLDFKGVFTHYNLPNYMDTKYYVERVLSENNLDVDLSEEFMSEYIELVKLLFYYTDINSLALPIYTLVIFERIGVQTISRDLLLDIFNLVQLEDDIPKVLLLDLISNIEEISLTNKPEISELEVIFTTVDGQAIELTLEDMISLLSSKPTYSKLLDSVTEDPKTDYFEKIIFYNNTKLLINYKGFDKDKLIFPPAKVSFSGDDTKRSFIRANLPYVPWSMDFKPPSAQVDLFHTSLPLKIRFKYGPFFWTDKLKFP